MISDEVEFVQSKQKDDPERPLSPEKMVRTMVKEYFTLIGALSGNKRGISILNETKLFSLLAPLISSGRSDLCKVIMTSLDYSQAGSARVLLSKGFSFFAKNEAISDPPFFFQCCKTRACPFDI